MTSAVNSWSKQALIAFWKRTDYQERTQTFLFDNKDNLGLTTAASLLSIGSGDGVIDTFLLSQCTPQLRSYCAVDVDSQCLSLMQSKIDEAHLDEVIKIRLVNADAAEWTDYTGGVDVILILHVLYYIPDQRKRIELLHRCIERLNPGGRLILSIIEWVPDHPMYMCAKKFGAKEGDYTDIKLREDLQAAGLTAMVDFDEKYNTTVNYKNPEKELADFLLYKDTDDEEAKAVAEYLQDILPPSQEAFDCSVVLSLKKDTFSTSG